MPEERRRPPTPRHRVLVHLANARASLLGALVALEAHEPAQPSAAAARVRAALPSLLAARAELHAAAPPARETLEATDEPLEAADEALQHLALALVALTHPGGDKLFAPVDVVKALDGLRGVELSLAARADAAEPAAQPMPKIGSREWLVGRTGDVGALLGKARDALVDFVAFRDCEASTAGFDAEHARRNAVGEALHHLGAALSENADFERALARGAA